MNLENQDKINDIYIKADQLDPLLTILSTALEEYPYGLTKNQISDLLYNLQIECSWIIDNLKSLVK